MLLTKSWIVVVIFICLSALTFGQLENAEYFSPEECYSIEARKSFFTKNYYEFSKLYNASTREKAVENFRNLLKNAKTQEAKAWAFFGLCCLGVEDVPKSMENVLLFTGEMGCKKETVYFHAYRDIRIPETYADIDIRDFKLPQPLDEYAKSVLYKTGVYTMDSIGCAYELPAEVWALNYLVEGKSDSEISAIAEDIWAHAENIEGRLYALLLFKRAGNEAVYSNHLSQLNPFEKFMHASGGIVVKKFTINEINNIESIFDVKNAFEILMTEYPPCVNPRDNNLNLIPLRKININLKKAEIKEDAIGYLPMRFRSEGTTFLCGEGLQKLARQWSKSKDSSERKALENILNKHLPPNSPAKFLADYGCYVLAIFVEKHGNKYSLVKRKAKIGEEPCFDPLFFSSTEIRKLEKRIFYGLIKLNLSGIKKEDDVSFVTYFRYADYYITKYLDTFGPHKKTLEKEFAEPFNSEDILGEFIVLSKFNSSVSAFLCPIFKDTPKEQIELLQKQHKRYLNVLDEESMRDYVLLTKSYKTILECNDI